MVAWLKALLFVGGGLAAAGGTAYVTGLLDPWIGRTPPIVAALPPEAVAPETPAPPAAAETIPEPEDPVTTEKQPRLAPPTFDLLRVEPDGSMLIAGNAPSHAQVEVLTGDRVLGNAEAGREGDFVVVLDEPLEPGDYQVVLRATAGGEAVMSVQTATVSIPDSHDGQVLAMVEEPGEPSRIITAPQPPAAAEAEPEATEPEVAAAPEEPEADVAAAPEPEPAEPEVAAEEPVAPAEEEIAAAPEAGQPETAEAPETAGEEIAAGEEPAQPEVAAEEPQAPAEEEIAAAPEEDAAAPEPEVAEQPGEQPAEPEVAVAPASGEPEVATEPAPAIEHRVVVEAVEIEGDKVFVAGYADPGRAVRVYANALLLGDTRASEAGRFLVEATRELPVGDYVIRADLLADDGTVLARAAVPFEREEGESIAAVAPPAAPEADEPEVTAEPEPAPAEEEIASAPEPEAAEEEIAAAPETPAPAEEPAAPGAPAEEIAAAPEEEVEIAAAPPADEADEPELTAPKLERADGAVIIRRGDNLWRISRRLYGLGVRYSTIYLANQDQIHDPNRIWPGQVFSVPQETPEGEVADMEAIGEQAVSPDTESQIIR